ncbi:C25 family cysteine peptidase [Roseimaritima ulvae]|uniref:Peptidase family C25 n=1 Tax=Roseimaritima ulvae TaxID=980254 RepID=A0A5B9QWU4_9BACT|nr:C25 family cysteine peptidase [Roseimaritima ulvae]QEG41586.1 Peptidase family C25 [Roseimaritima ulvae]
MDIQIPNRLGWFAGLLIVVFSVHRAAAVEPAAAADAVVVCPTEFRDALTPLLARRAADGLSLRVVDSAASAAEVQQRIGQAADPEKTRFIVLVGDCAIGRSDGDSNPQYEVPTLHRAAGVTAAWGTTPQLPGDTFYGDLDADGIPEAVVGRIPVDSAEQLSAYIRRIAAYEDSTDFGAWRQRVLLTAGVGGFGFLADAAIESVTRSMITGSLPASTRTHVTYASPSSPFNPGLDRFHEAVLQQYARGARFWVYAGHGRVTELDRVPQTASGRAVLTVHDVDRLQLNGAPPPIALMLACYTGAFDANQDCLAEQMLLADEGPIAVLAGSRITLPYGNAAVATGLIRGVYEQRSERLGDAWLASLRELATLSKNDPELNKRRAVIDTLAGLISPTAADLPAERREHMQLYNLLGDPMLRLQHPETVSLDVEGKAAQGQTLVVRGQTPLAGTLSIALHRAIGSVPTGTAADERYRLANETEITRLEIDVDAAGPFQARLAIPEQAAGTLHLVAHIKNADRYAVGDARILVYAR